MTREEIMELGIEEIEKRTAEIAEETREADEEQVNELNEELDAIEERKAALREEIETRAKAVEAVKLGEGTVVEEHKEQRTMENVRDSKEYRNAYGEYIKKGYDLDKLTAEQRALLTVNAENGIIEVPTNVLDKINTAWERSAIIERITKTFFKGNLKVGFEKSATGAEVHTEGGNPVRPEDLVIEYVELIPEMLKKVVEVSDEVLANNESMVDYLYDEIEYQIVKLADKKIVGKINDSENTQSYTLAGDAPTTADLIGAAALLSGEATNPVVITTRANAASIKAGTLSAGYAYDPFDGMDVLYADAETLGDSAFIIADLSAVHGNFPEGYGARFKFDDLSKADADLVRIIGRLYAAFGVVAAGKTVKAVAGA